MTNSEKVEAFQLAYIAGFAILVSLGLVFALRWQRKKLLENFPTLAAILVAFGVLSDRD